MKQKSGFTFVEITITIVIICILIAVGFITMKPQKSINNTKVKYRYASALQTLNTVNYELTLSNDEIVNPFLADNNFSKMCRGLADWINTEETHCDIPPIEDNIAYMTNENFDFKTLTPHIVTQNGMKLYISNMIVDQRMPKESRSYYDILNPEFDLQFFMVYVDVNAEEKKNKPHTIVYDSSEKTITDVYAFALLPIGKAIPIGLAEYYIKVLPTKISYKSNGTRYTDSRYSYREAKHLAWNMYNNDSSEYAGTFKSHMAYTWNDYIKEMLDLNNTQLYNFLTDGSFTILYDTPQYEKCIPPEESTKTHYDLCNIVFEKLPSSIVRGL